MTLICDPACYSRGRLLDLTIIDAGVLGDDTAVAGDSKAVSSIIGTAHAGNGSSQAASNARITRYDLLFFRMGQPNVAAPVYDAAYDGPLFGYRASTKAVGWAVSGPCIDDQAGEELLLPGQPITLEWGAYWLILSTVAAGNGVDPSNNGLWQYLQFPTGVRDGVPYVFTLTSPAILNGLTSSGLTSLGIINQHVIGFRINRRS